MSASDTSSDSRADKDGQLARFRRACSRREYCCSDIRNRLARQNIVGRQADDIVSVLKSEGFVDDARYARAYCRDKSGLSGWGEAKIRYALGRKGIPDHIIEEALSHIDSDAACRRMDAVISSKWSEILRRHPGLSRSECLSRLLRFAAGRGYQYAEVMESLKRNEL